MASGLRLQSGIPTQDERRYQAAEEHHSQAAAIYRACLDLHPTNAIETRFALGQAYRFAGRLDEAIETFAAVRDAATDHPLVTAAAEQIVFCMERRLAEEQRSTEHYWQDGVVEPLTAFPQHLAALIDARDQYARRTDAENESRARFLLDNARLLLRTGREAEARSRLTDLLERHCAGPPASPRAREALAMLTELALARGDDAQVERLARSTEARQCTLDPTRRWRPAGAFTTAMIDTRLRSLAERAWESERDGRNGEAMRAYLQLAASSDDAETSATALVRATAVAESERATLVAALRDWLARDRHAPNATEVRLEAISHLADLLHDLGREAERRTVRAELARLGRSHPLPPSWPLAHVVAEAQLETLRDVMASFRIAPGRQPTVQAFVREIRIQIDRIAQET